MRFPCEVIIECFLHIIWVEFPRSSSFILFIASSISLGVFKDDTCDIQWRQKYSSSCVFLWLHLLLDLHLLLWHSSPCHSSSSMRSIIYFHAYNFSTVSMFSSILVLFFNMLKMRISNGNREDRTYQWECFNLMLAWKLFWKTAFSGSRVWSRNPNFST